MADTPLDHHAVLTLSVAADSKLYQRTSRDKRSIPKTVNGKPVTQGEFRRAVIDAIDGRGTATPLQVALDIGNADTRQCKELVAVQMRNMRREGLLERVNRALYTLASSCQISVDTGLEDNLLKILRSFGGMARESEIFDSLDLQIPVRRVHRTLIQSSRIFYYGGGSKDRAQAMWGLSWEEMATEPMSGRNAEWLIRESKDPRFSDADRRTIIKENCQTIGFALKRVREDHRELDLNATARLPAIAKVLDAIKGRSPHLVQQAEAGAELAHILDELERGNAKVHRATPANLFRAYEEEFQYCAASLSRGTVLVRCKPERA